MKQLKKQQQQKHKKKKKKTEKKKKKKSTHTCTPLSLPLSLARSQAGPTQACPPGTRLFICRLHRHCFWRFFQCFGHWHVRSAPCFFVSSSLSSSVEHLANLSSFSLFLNFALSYLQVFRLWL